MPEKVLFLDVDGVLNTTGSRSLYALKRACLQRLEKIVNETGCKLVLSSTWRKDDRAFTKLQKKLEFRHLSIWDKTPVAGKDWAIDHERPQTKMRGYEIAMWLFTNMTERYVIVDDDSDFLEHQLKWFVQTDPEYGLTDTLAYRIIQKLNG